MFSKHDLNVDRGNHKQLPIYTQQCYSFGFVFLVDVNPGIAFLDSRET